MFQARASVQVGAAAAAKAETRQTTTSPESATVRIDPAFSDLQVWKILVRLEPGDIWRQALRTSRVIQRNHLVHDGVQGVALAIAVINTSGRRRSRDLRD